MRILIGGLVALGLTASTGDLVRISTSGPIVSAGYSFRVRCSVSRQAENRWLEAGIEAYTSSGVQLDGEYAPVTHEFWFGHIPCDVRQAYCWVRRNDSREAIVKAPVRVVGCAE
mgnify:CR=1 FL=1